MKLINGGKLAGLVRDGVKAAFGFTIRRALWVGFVVLMIQIGLAIAWILFVSPENMMNLFNGLFTRMGFEPINCETLPQAVCPLLNIAGLNEMYNKGCYYAIRLLLIWLAIKRLVLLGRTWYVLRGFGG